MKKGVHPSDLNQKEFDRKGGLMKHKVGDKVKIVDCWNEYTKEKQRKA
mgnify:CR=1 FL=1